MKSAVISLLRNQPYNGWPFLLFGFVMALIQMSKAPSLAWTALTLIMSMALYAMLPFFMLPPRHNIHGRLKGKRPVRLDIWVEGAKIGEMDDAELAAIELTQLQKRFDFATDTSDFPRLLGSVAGRLALAVPALIFWIAVAVLIAAPSWSGQFIEAVRADFAHDLASEFNKLAHFGVRAYFVTVVIVSLNLHVLNIVKRIDSYQDRIIRERFNLRGDDAIRVVRQPTQYPVAV